VAIADKLPRNARLRAVDLAALTMQGLRLFAAVAALAAAFSAAAQVTPPPIAARAFFLVDAMSGQALAGRARTTASSRLPSRR
jgi:D-alanyl-D-alanine carboxypeptidase